MDAESFVKGLIQSVRQSSVEGTIEVLSKPVGRKPSSRSLELSSRFNELSGQDRKFVRSVIEESVDSALFGFLCVLDGVRVVEDRNPKGSFELWYKGTSDRLLNSDDGEMLHDLYLTALPKHADTRSK